MDSVSRAEIRLIAAELAEVNNPARRDELLQALEFILQQEEAGQSNTDPAHLFPYSITREIDCVAYPAIYHVDLVPQRTFVMGGLYLDGALASLSRPDKRWGCNVHGHVSVGCEIMGQPLNLRGRICQTGLSIWFGVSGAAGQHTVTLLGNAYDPYRAGAAISLSGIQDMLAYLGT